jgi:7-keto-8-aminopelargonate synthetase-like enzyme
LHIQAFGQANTFSNTLGPVNTASVLAALEIVRGPEGGVLRSRVLDAATRLREACRIRELEVLGRPSALVPVLIGDEHLGRLVCREAGELGVLSNFIEFPAVAVGRSRLRLQVTPAHDEIALDQVAERLADARSNAASVGKHP